LLKGGGKRRGREKLEGGGHPCLGNLETEKKTRDGVLKLESRQDPKGGPRCEFWRSGKNQKKNLGESKKAGGNGIKKSREWSTRWQGVGDAKAPFWGLKGNQNRVRQRQKNNTPDRQAP